MPFINNDIKTLQNIAKLQNKIKSDTLSTIVGDSETYIDNSKIFKPITDVNQTTTNALTKQLQEIASASNTTNELMKSLPQIDFPLKPMINDNDSSKYINIGSNASHYLSTNRTNWDKAFGLNYDSNNRIYKLGNFNVEFQDDDLIINNQKYSGTKGFWELMTKKDPDYSVITDSDKQIYFDLLDTSKALYSSNGKVKSNRSYKYNYIIKPLYKQQGKTGKGYVFLPSDPNILIERLSVLIANKFEGHTINYNEVQPILQSLLRQEIINEHGYKKVIRILDL